MISVIHRRFQVVVTLAVLLLARAAASGVLRDEDRPRRGNNDEENMSAWQQVCPCTCWNPIQEPAPAEGIPGLYESPYTSLRGRQEGESDIQESLQYQTGVLVQIIPIPGSPPEHTQYCFTPAVVYPALRLFPFAIWYVACLDFCSIPHTAPCHFSHDDPSLYRHDFSLLLQVRRRLPELKDMNPCEIHIPRTTVLN